jgi:hypothetical protein
LLPTVRDPRLLLSVARGLPEVIGGVGSLDAPVRWVQAAVLQNLAHQVLARAPGGDAEDVLSLWGTHLRHAVPSGCIEYLPDPGRYGCVGPELGGGGRRGTSTSTRSAAQRMSMNARTTQVGVSCAV